MSKIPYVKAKDIMDVKAKFVLDNPIANRKFKTDYEYYKKYKTGYGLIIRDKDTNEFMTWSKDAGEFVAFTEEQKNKIFPKGMKNLKASHLKSVYTYVLQLDDEYTFETYKGDVTTYVVNADLTFAQHKKLQEKWEEMEEAGKTLYMKFGKQGRGYVPELTLKEFKGSMYEHSEDYSGSNEEWEDIEEEIKAEDDVNSREDSQRVEEMKISDEEPEEKEEEKEEPELTEIQTNTIQTAVNSGESITDFTAFLEGGEYSEEDKKLMLGKFLEMG